MTGGGKRIELSGRLLAAAGMVTKGNVVCDVGCDHGYVPIYLVQNGISPRVIAMDVKEGPLRAAREHINGCLLADYIETRLSDGMEALKTGEADTLICAGMGGRLMKRILDEGGEKTAGMKELILQPQSEVQGMREYLRKMGYRITSENMILEEGKFYPMMKACPPGASGSGCEETQDTEALRIEDRYGPLLLRTRHPVLKLFLQREDALCGEILDQLRSHGTGRMDRIREIEDKRKDIRTALSYYKL